MVIGVYNPTFAAIRTPMVEGLGLLPNLWTEEIFQRIGPKCGGLLDPSPIGYAFKGDQRESWFDPSNHYGEGEGHGVLNGDRSGSFLC